MLVSDSNSTRFSQSEDMIDSIPKLYEKYSIFPYKLKILHNIFKTYLLKT